MNTTKSFDRSVATDASAMLKAALSGIDSDAFVFDVAGGAFSADEFTVKVKVTLKGGINIERMNLEAVCKIKGIDPDASYHLTNLGLCKLERFDSRKPKYPWIVKALNGKLYKITDESLARAAGAIAPAAAAPIAPADFVNVTGQRPNS